MGWFKEIFDDALGIVQAPKPATVAPVTAEGIVAAAVEQGVLQKPTTPEMEPIPLATFDSLWPLPDEPVKVQNASIAPAGQPSWLLLGLGALWWAGRKR